MIDHGTKVRKAFFQALDGNLTYDSIQVPVTDSKIEENVLLYVVISGQNDDNKSNKSRFAYEVNVTVDIVNRRKASGKSIPVEEVSSLILAIIKPTPATHGLVIDAPLSITFCRFEGSQQQDLIDDATNDFIHVKRLNFRIRITQ